VSQRLLPAVISAFAVAACIGGPARRTGDTAPPRDGVGVADSAGMIVRNLTTFDTLDFVVFSHQQFDRFKESHADDVTVTWPDGHETHGLARHIEDMRAMFVAMPDLAITAHPIKIANGSWTAVSGRMQGTFSRQMPLGDGRTAPPNGRKLDLPIATIAHWTPAGVMDHEWLFWDKQAYLTQLGLAQ
jgi:predicted ester cyclase